MAQLKSSVVLGDLRVTDNISTGTLTASSITLPTAATNSTDVLKWINANTEYGKIFTTSNGAMIFGSKRIINLCPGNVEGATAAANSYQFVSGVSVCTDAFIPMAAETLTLGSEDSTWSNVYASGFNSLVLTPAATGFTIAGGTTSKTLTVSATATIKSSTDTGSANYIAYYSSANNIKGHGSTYFDDTAGTTSAAGKNNLVLGNSTKTGTAGNQHGVITLFTDGAGGISLGTAAATDNWYDINLPNKSGTIALTSDITSGVSLASQSTTTIYLTGAASASSTSLELSSATITTGGVLTATTVKNAVWNDYAEYRRTLPRVKPGQCIIDNDDGSLSIATKRLLPGAQIVSDTWGHIMGETEDAKTPVAVAGRVLAYTTQPRENYHAGMAVCSGPDGTVDIMTREEIKEYPDCIIGYVSEIPNYETWGSGNVKVDGRIWVRVK